MTNSNAAAAQPAAAQEAVPYGYVFTDDPAKFAMPGSGFHFGPVPPTDAINVAPLYAAPVAAAPVDAPSIESAHAMGAKGAPANDAERLAFEAWMRGHCWALCATWDGAGYRSDAEQGGGYCPNAARTRMLWAAWRDRAALASDPAAPGIDLTAAEVGVIETLLALAYAVWNAADNGEDNGESLTIERSDFAAVDKALDALEELPDDQPGYAMEAAAKARWALRRVLSAPLIDASPKGGSDAEVQPTVIPDNDDTRQILGRLNFQCYTIANRLRLRGDKIPNGSEKEQAAVIRFLLNHYLASPNEWRANADAELALIRKQATSAEVGA